MLHLSALYFLLTSHLFPHPASVRRMITWHWAAKIQTALVGVWGLGGLPLPGSCPFFPGKDIPGSHGVALPPHPQKLF